MASDDYVSDWHKIVLLKESVLAEKESAQTKLKEALLVEERAEKIAEELRAEIAITRAEIAYVRAHIEAEIAIKATKQESGISVCIAFHAYASRDYFDLVTQLGAPSSLCKAENRRQAQEKLIYLCHIPQEAEPPFPLTLVHPAFANFVDRFNTSKIEFGADECEFVLDLCYLVVKDEKEKMDAFNLLLGEYLGHTVARIFVKPY